MDAHGTVMDGHGRSWTVMDGHGRSWTVMDGHGRSWTVMGRSWTLMDGHGRSDAHGRFSDAGRTQAGRKSDDL
jgi:hypothetical protein